MLYDFMTNAMEKDVVVDKCLVECYKAFEDIFTAKSEFLHMRVAAGTPPNEEQLTRFMSSTVSECEAATSTLQSGNLDLASAPPILGSLMLHDLSIPLHAQ